MKSLLLFLAVFLMAGFPPAQAQWQSLGGIGKDVAAQSNTAWTIGSDNGIWHHSGGSWQQYPGGGRGQAIDVAPNGIPYVIGTDNGIHRGTGSGWVQLPGGGRGKDIAVDKSGRPWVIGMHDGIHFFDGANWHEYPGGGRAKAIAVGPGGTPFVIGNDRAVWQGTGSRWVHLPGAVRGKDIAVDGRGRPWVVGIDNQVYYHEGGTWHLLPGGLRGHRIAVTDSGVPLVIGMDKAIWRYGGAPLSGPVPPAASSNLTGRWNGNDGGKYFLRQVGNELWWYGMSGDGGASWTNVFQGRIEGKKVRGRWADVPLGRIMGDGEMHLQVLSPNHLRATHRTGGFGGSDWTR